MKVLHILGYDEIKFNLPLVQMLSNEDLGWEDEFYFATNNLNLYETIKEYKNTIFFEIGISSYINQIWKEYDLIVIQGWNQTVARASVLRKKATKKIVWRFWGSDCFPYEESASIKSKIAGKLLFPVLCRKISNFYGIGYGSITDVKLINKRFHIRKGLKGSPLSFRYEKGTGEQYRKIYEESLKEIKRPLRVMIGHSANERENHILTLERLRKFSDKELEIVLVLSYGKDNYRKKVIEKAREIFKDKVDVITEMMPIDQYRKFLSQVDIFAIESMGSNALGNVEDLIYFGKKIYVRKNSFLDDYLNEISVDHFLVEDIEEMTFKNFSDKNYDKVKNHNIFLSKEDDKVAVKGHKELYAEYRRNIG